MKYWEERKRSREMPIRERERRGLGAPGISGADGERDVIKNLQPLLGRTKLLTKAALLDTKGGCNFFFIFMREDGASFAPGTQTPHTESITDVMNYSFQQGIIPRRWNIYSSQKMCTLGNRARRYLSAHELYQFSVK
jgi:hypothetical protein